MASAVVSKTLTKTTIGDSLKFKLAGFMLGQLVNQARVRISSRNSNLDMIINKGDSRLDNKPYYHMELESNVVLWNMLRNPDPGMGESYMDGEWWMESGDMGAFLTMLGRGRDQMLSTRLGRFLRVLTNKRPPKYEHDIDSSYGHVQHHYDIGNDLYKTFLDEGMNYSCAFFSSKDQSLRDAQLNKIHTTIQRLDVQDGMKVLDIGCGWGETCRIISEKMHAEATGITLAKTQLEFATTIAGEHSDTPNYLLQDYREHAQHHPNYYDRIVSIGMVEHVGKKNLEKFFQAVIQQLKPGGRALIHSIVRSGKPATVNLASPWLIKYIFPGGHIPEVSELTQAAENQGLKMMHSPYLHDSFHYAETLRRWRHNFLEKFDKLDPEKYDQRFKRMWVYYYCMCEGMFEGCDFRVAQIVVGKK